MSALASKNVFHALGAAELQSGPDLKLSADVATDAARVIDFNPPEATATRILSDLARPGRSLGDVAERAGATTESLAIWLSRPDISARLAVIESACARVARLNTAACAPAMIEAAAHIIGEYPSNESDIDSSADPRNHIIANRSRQAALAACRILLRLMRENSPPTRTTSSARAADLRRHGQTSVQSTSDADQPPDLPLDDSRSADNDPCDKNGSHDTAAASRPEGPPVLSHGHQPSEPMHTTFPHETFAEPRRGGTLPVMSPDDGESGPNTSAFPPISITASPYPSASSPPQMHPPPESP